MDKTLLKNIGLTDDVDAVLFKLQSFKNDINTVQSIVADTVDTSKSTTVAPTIDESINSVIMLKRTLRQFELLVDTFQQKADKNIEPFKFYLDNLIYNYKTAYDATERFNKDWFANQMFSEQGKIELASYMLKSISTYCKDNTQTLSMIANGDVDLLNYIRLPKDYRQRN